MELFNFGNTVLPTATHVANSVRKHMANPFLSVDQIVAQNTV